MWTFNKILTKSVEVIDEEERIFKGIVTAEILDRQGEITFAKQFLENLKAWDNRDRPIMDWHSNRVVGKGLEYYPVTIIDKDGSEVAGVAIEAQIHKDTPIDDKIWEYIKTRKYKGLSFGGMARTPNSKIPVKTKNGMYAYGLTDTPVWEISVCPEPAAHWAVITDFNSMAKSYDEEELKSMCVKKSGEEVRIICEKNQCYVIESPKIEKYDSETKETKSKGTAILDDIDDNKKMLIKGTEGLNNKDMEENDKKDDKKDEYKVESEEKKTDDSKDTKDDKKEEENKSSELEKLVADLAKSTTKLVEKAKENSDEITSIKSDLAKISKALETPAPAEDHKAGDNVKLDDTYVDHEQGTEDPKKHDKGEDKDKVPIEQKADEDEKEDAKDEEKKSDDKFVDKSTVGRSGNEDLHPSLKNKSSNSILEKGRELGGDRLGELALMINKGTFGKVSTTPEGYPEV